MKELWFILKVAIFSIALFVYGYSLYYPLPIHFQSKFPVFDILLFAYFFFLVRRPLRYHEPFVKPYKGYDSAFKIVAFTPPPLLCGYFCFIAILSAIKSVSFASLFFVLLAFVFFKTSDMTGWSLIQSWYEDKEGKFLRIVRR